MCAIHVGLFIVLVMLAGNRCCCNSVVPFSSPQIFERPYHDTILLPRGCLCNSSNTSHLPVEYTSTSRDVEVHFTAYNMTTLDDPDALNFEGMFEFVKGPTNCKDGRRKFGPSGTIDMTFGDVSMMIDTLLFSSCVDVKYILEYACVLVY